MISEDDFKTQVEKRFIARWGYLKWRWEESPETLLEYYDAVRCYDLDTVSRIASWYCNEPDRKVPPTAALFRSTCAELYDRKHPVSPVSQPDFTMGIPTDDKGWSRKCVELLTSRTRDGILAGLAMVDEFERKHHIRREPSEQADYDRLKQAAEKYGGEKLAEPEQPASTMKPDWTGPTKVAEDDEVPF